MVSGKAWKTGEPGEPAFPSEFDVVRNAVLQVTDIRTNRNKYYALELHQCQKPASGDLACRLFTHYGRTDDLEVNPESGQKECRYFGSLAEAQAAYEAIYRQKTGSTKGYREVSLAASRIGSARARGTGSGEIDAKTLEKLAKAKADAAAKVGKALPEPKRLDLHPAVADLVRYLYAEATNALTTSVCAKITAEGIETPLGILTIGQIEKGEAILAEAYKVFQEKSGSVSGRKRKLEQLSGEFYTVIPHRIGRSRAAVEAAVLGDVGAFAAKQETLQLMKDMLNVNGDGGSVLYDAQVDSQYLSLKCDVRYLEKGGAEYRQIEQYVHKSQARGERVRVQNVYAVRRPGEHEAFTSQIDNQRLLFHGSRMQNWVGLLSRGILLPKLAVTLGARRTDAGWLGHGIYFGDSATTSAAYTSPGKRKTSFMALARVALGRMKDYTQITYGLTAPPEGFDSCHGAPGTRSSFYDHEYVVYNTRQQRMEYLVEFTW